MALKDILAKVGDSQDFVLEISAGNSSYVPTDILLEENGVMQCSEIPEVVNQGGSNIFIMSE